MIVKFAAVPTQPAVLIGVTVILAVIREFELFLTTNAGMLPVPLAAKPILGSLFTQLYVVPATLPLNTTGVVVALSHNI